SPDNSNQEFKLTGSISIGRANDNTVCLAGDAISRYHAIIEERTEGFWLSDLGSVHGTFVNDKPVGVDHLLRDGDVISVGLGANLRYLDNSSTSSVAATNSKTASMDKGESASGATSSQGARGARKIAGFSPELIAIAAAGMLVLTILGGLIYIIIFKRENCGSVSIESPSARETISSPVKVRVRADNPACIKSVSYRIDGSQFAKPSPDLFEATLDPAEIKARFPGMADGEHELSIMVETGPEGAQSQAERVSVKIVFPDHNNGFGLGEIRGMVEKLAGRINGRGEIFVFDEKFLEQIRDAVRS